MTNVYVVTWMTSDYDQINVQNEGVYTNKDDAMEKVNDILKNILSDLNDDYGDDKWSNTYDNSTHYIIDDFNGRYDEVIISKQTLKENK